MTSPRDSASGPAAHVAPWVASRPVGVLTSAVSRAPKLAWPPLFRLPCRAACSSLFLLSLICSFPRNAKQPAALLARAVQRYAPSTLQLYMSVWKQWCQFAACSSFAPASPASGVLPGWLLQNSSHQGLASGSRKVLSWMSRVAGLPALQQALNTAVANLHASNPRLGARRCPSRSASFVGWSAGLCLLTHMADKVAWWAFHLEPRAPRQACTGMPCSMDLLARRQRLFDFLPAMLAGSASAPMPRPEAIPWIRSLLQEHWSSVSSGPLPAAYALVGVNKGGILCLCAPARRGSFFMCGL